MNETTVGLIGIGLLLLLFFLNMPIAFTMAFVGLLGLIYLSSLNVGLGYLIQDIYSQFSSYTLGTIPMFVLMGYYADSSGMGGGLYRCVRAWLGQLRGGLALATIGGCAAFAAACGSTVATAAMMGKIAYPEMKKYNYSDILATGTIAAGGALGTLIPPSNVFIVYASLAEVPIGKQFIAGFLPGIVMTLLFMGVVIIYCAINPNLGPKSIPVSWRERIMSLGGLAGIALLFVLVIGGLWVGWFAPTQAGVIGAVGVLAYGLIRRKLTWQKFLKSTREGLRSGCMIMFIITGAIIFGHFMSFSKVPMFLVEWIQGANISPSIVIMLLCVIFFVAGFFMDSMALVVIIVPIILPLLVAMKYNLIVFGVLLVILTETGVITPPVGVNVFVVKGIAKDVSLESIFKGAFPFVGAMLITLILVFFYPQIALFLPNLQ